MKSPILLVEDNSDDVFLLQQAGRKAGIDHPMQVAEHGRRAIEYLSGDGDFSNREKYPLPALVLLDLQLPYVTGLEVLRWIRERSEHRTLLVVVLTSSNQLSDVDAAYKLGANSFLVKPGRLDGLQSLFKALAEYWLHHNHPPIDLHT